MNLYRRALITGATSGIGAAFAEELPRTTNLLLAGRDAEKLKEKREALLRKGRKVETYAADLTDERAVQDLISRADDFGVDLLINNAGVGRFGRLIDNDPKSERGTAMLNVVAVVVLTRGLLPGMIERAREANRRGGVVIVSSTAAFSPVPYFATYAASKAFNLYFAEALAEEMRDDPVDVLALCPGATRTPFGARAGFEFGAIAGSRQSQHRGEGSPERAREQDRTRDRTAQSGHPGAFPGAAAHYDRGARGGDALFQSSAILRTGWERGRQIRSRRLPRLPFNV